MGFFVLLFVFMLFDFFFIFWGERGCFVYVCVYHHFLRMFYLGFFLFFGNAEYIIIFIYLEHCSKPLSKQS